MKLIIDIDERVYNYVVNECGLSEDLWEITDAFTKSKPLQTEFEDIVEEITRNRDEWVKGEDAEWHTYDRCLAILDKHIKENK